MNDGAVVPTASGTSPSYDRGGAASDESKPSDLSNGGGGSHPLPSAAPPTWGQGNIKEDPSADENPVDKAPLVYYPTGEADKKAGAGSHKKKRPVTAMKKAYIALRKFTVAIGLAALAIFVYMPVILKIIVGLFILFILSLIYLPRSVKHRWEVKFMVAQGWTLRQWFVYLARHNFVVDPIYWHRALFITVISTFTSFVWAPKEEKEYPEETIRATTIQQPPLFILGHFRSGTTRLHELMSKDDRFVAPTVYQCFAPRVFLHREEAISEQFGKLQMRRPMDSVKVRMESPQEDEFGLVNLCGLSPYMGAIFARAERIKNTYFQYLSFKEASTEEVARWKDAVVFFYKKVLFKKQDKRLILKSPAHTARLKLLHELFPDAKFIHISRNPFEVYQSTSKLFMDLLIQWNLQYVDYLGDIQSHPEDTELHRSILQLYGGIYDSFFQDLDELGLGKDVLTYVKYEDLMRSPVGVVEKIYKDLRLGNFENVQQLLLEATAKDGEFRRNAHPNISANVKNDVRTRLARYFTEFGYEPEHGTSVSQ
ncbi:hypothetical protein Naga_100058g18 [Nannochloropsis gaditana]|uniref:Sulfotransferase n=1 Tax=Nannochloropsis gaditana TaxID=72520 RepID=W7TQX3_9STRA|nr:hypothetical protein Naga_100058g18 [Nannochloropsis gaditana]